MSKSIKSTSPLYALVQLKMEVINYHKGEENEYLRAQIAKDACYTSNNSIQYKTEMMSRVKEEIAMMIPEQGSEVTDVNLGKKIFIYRSMEQELEELEQRHKADLEVHKKITGEDWSARPKKKQSSNAEVTEALAILGR